MSSLLYITCDKRYIGLFVNRKVFLFLEKWCIKCGSYSKACPQGTLSDKVVLEAEVIKSLFKVKVKP